MGAMEPNQILERVRARLRDGTSPDERLVLVYEAAPERSWFGVHQEKSREEMIQVFREVALGIEAGDPIPGAFLFGGDRSRDLLYGSAEGPCLLVGLDPVRGSTEGDWVRTFHLLLRDGAYLGTRFREEDRDELLEVEIRAGSRHLTESLRAPVLGAMRRRGFRPQG